MFMLGNRKMRQILQMPVPKRFSELIALISVSTTVFLFFHTQMLNSRIEQIQGILTASASGGSAHPNSISSTVNRLVQPPPPQKLIQVNAGVTTFTLPNLIYNATALNNTRHSSKDILFFNRVPKVGSQSMMDLLQRLSHQNDFRFHRDGTQKVETIRLTYYEESRLTTMVDMFSPPASYVKHTCFSNFTRHGYQMPIYVNIVRDPIERIISWFYYIRAPWYIIERKQAFPELPLPHPNWLKKDFESCVLSGDRECLFLPGEYHDGVGDHRRQAMFFCGHDEKCVEFNGDWAIQKAKRNVEQHYSVVGVLEEMDVTLQVLEKFVPRFFTGATKLYYDNLGTMQKINKNMYKPPVSEQVKNLLRQNFTKEIEFYEFCRQRLHMQYVSLLQLEGVQPNDSQETRRIT